MRKAIFILFITMAACFAHSQNAEVQKIMTVLESLNREVVSKKCGDEDGMIVTNRGLNYFFANKIGSYLSESGDISLFKNYATLNTAGGEFSLNHNFGNPGRGALLRPLSSVGIRAKLADGFATIFSEQEFRNDLGLLLKRTWFGRGSTLFGNCPYDVDGRPDTRPTQKALMNAKRSFILHSLEMEMHSRSKEFESVLAGMKATEFENPGELENARTSLRQSFYKNLQKDYEKKFAEQEAKALGGDSSHNLITTHWATIMVYIPVTTQRFNIAPSLSESFGAEELYPWKINFNYSEFVESRTAGRIMLYFDAGIFQNNSVNTRGVDKIKLMEYKNQGGTDTVRFAELDIEEAYIGNYKTFATPFTKLQLVWFPKKANAGISLMVEKNFGKFAPLNTRLGLPVRFNDRNGNPSVNFELQLRASDINKAINSSKSFGKRLSVGFSVGLPFNSRVY